MSFTDGKRWAATAEDLGRHWSLAPKGRNFRCGLCGHRFEEGDGVRWQYGSGRNFEIDGKTFGVRNFLVCDACDGSDVLDRWVALHVEFHQPKFWALRA